MLRRGRRQFLQASASLLGSATAAAPLSALFARWAHGALHHADFGYGALQPTADLTTGLPLLLLPDGFTYRSFGWTGDVMTDGRPTPPLHDGMAVIQHRDGELILSRNHEVTDDADPIGDADITFDSRASAGCTNLAIADVSGKLLRDWVSISGTLRNCAGGPTPWGTWLTCEETVLGPGDVVEERQWNLEHDHGWIFEVPADQAVDPKPLEAMGRFVHEAVAVDPHTGIVYETEDRNTSGFYRFIPDNPSELAAGGRLQMMRVVGQLDLRTGLNACQRFDVQWIEIQDPQRRHSPGTSDTLGVYQQGKAQDAATFSRLEGCWFQDGLVYFVATDGGDAAYGQVWVYNPANEQLQLLFESPGPTVLNYPDNVTVSPRGGILTCEDNDQPIQRMQGISTKGMVFPFAENNVVLDGQRNGIQGDFRGGEWAGCTFSPDGKWLFVNIQEPGVTFAITGPWQDGLL